MKGDARSTQNCEKGSARESFSAPCRELARLQLPLTSNERETSAPQGLPHMHASYFVASVDTMPAFGCMLATPFAEGASGCGNIVRMSRHARMNASPLRKTAS